jgi:hypothetical protein
MWKINIINVLEDFAMKKQLLLGLLILGFVPQTHGFLGFLRNVKGKDLIMMQKSAGLTFVGSLSLTAGALCGGLSCINGGENFEKAAAPVAFGLVSCYVARKFYQELSPNVKRYGRYYNGAAGFAGAAVAVTPLVALAGFDYLVSGKWKY